MPPPMPSGMLGAAHKPGAIPLRPLGLGDMYDGAFRVIRFNPRATVGSAVLVAAGRRLPAGCHIPVAIWSAVAAGFAVSPLCHESPGAGAWRRWP